MRNLFIAFILLLAACKQDDPQPAKPTEVADTLTVSVTCPGNCTVIYNTAVSQVMNSFTKQQTIGAKGEWVVEVKEAKGQVSARFVVNGLLVAEMTSTNSGKLSYLR